MGSDAVLLAGKGSWRSATAVGSEAARRLLRKSTLGPSPETGGEGSTAAKLWAPRPAKARALLGGESPGVEITACLDIIRPGEKADEGEPPTGPPRGRLGERELPPCCLGEGRASWGLLARRSGASSSLLPAPLSRERTSRLRLRTSSPGLTCRSGSAVARARRAARCSLTHLA